MNQLDHVVIAAPDLERAIEAFADQTGCRPEVGGAHQGLGTRNALVSFGGTSYLELIAPDREQDLHGTFGSVLASLREPEPLHWAVRVTSLEAVADEAARIGFTPGTIRDTARVTPDGQRLEWRLLGIGGHELGGLVPFYIDWLASPHPADTVPVVGPLDDCIVTADDERLHHLIGMTSGVDYRSGDNSLTFAFESERGPVTYTTTNPRGFSL